MKKQGQFFLIAALLISGIAIGFSTLYNSAYIERSDTQVYDLSEELYAELQQTYDSGMVRGETEPEIQANLKKLAEYYQLQNPDSTFVIFHGNPDSEACKTGTVECVQRLDTSAEAFGSELTLLTDEDSPSTQDTTGGTRGTQSISTTSPAGDHSSIKKVKIRVRFKDASAQQTQTGSGTTASQKQSTEERVLESPPFELKPGQNFYLVIRQKVKNEQVVVYRK